MQNLTSKRASPTAKAATAPKTETASAPRPKARPATKVTTGSFPEAPPATKFATAAAVEPPPIYMEPRSREDEHAEAIQRLEAEVETLKLNATGMQQAMDQKMRLYIKMLIGGMSVLGMLDIFR
jgi:hypothetical protein